MKGPVEKTVLMMMDEQEREHPTEEEIDETLKESFPASDPPSWTLGIDDNTNDHPGRPDATQPDQEPDAKRRRLNPPDPTASKP